METLGSPALVVGVSPAAWGHRPLLNPPLFNNIEQSWAGPEKVSSEEETEREDRVKRT